MKTSPGFMSNTPDPKTVDSQIVKLQQRFHAAHITLMGDRGVPRGLRPEAPSTSGTCLRTEHPLERLILALFQQSISPRAWTICHRGAARGGCSVRIAGRWQIVQIPRHVDHRTRVRGHPL